MCECDLILWNRNSNIQFDNTQKPVYYNIDMSVLVFVLLIRLK